MSDWGSGDESLVEHPDAVAAHNDGVQAAGIGMCAHEDQMWQAPE